MTCDFLESALRPWICKNIMFFILSLSYDDTILITIWFNETGKIDIGLWQYWLPNQVTVLF